MADGGMSRPVTVWIHPLLDGAQPQRGAPWAKNAPEDARTVMQAEACCAATSRRLGSSHCCRGMITPHGRRTGKAGGEGARSVETEFIRLGGARR